MPEISRRQFFATAAAAVLGHHVAGAGKMVGGEPVDLIWIDGQLVGNPEHIPGIEHVFLWTDIYRLSSRRVGLTDLCYGRA